MVGVAKIKIKMTTPKLVGICVIIGALIGVIAKYLANLVANSVLEWAIKIGALAVGGLAGYELWNHFENKKNSKL
ncbi:hypothetical protein P5Z00_09430 [Lacticaseibacillus sp. BCRC 81376]|jgi:uncharacterized membrane protein YjjB (DUF3815 family)|nr:hypothetical protein [Lacticaseibacillus sp. BCRC 81376]